MNQHFQNYKGSGSLKELAHEDERILSGHQVVDVGGIEINLFSAAMQKSASWTGSTPVGTWFFVFTSGSVLTQGKLSGQREWKAGDLFVHRFDEEERCYHEVLADGEVSGVFIRFNNDTIEQYFESSDCERFTGAAVFDDNKQGMIQKLANSMLHYPDNGPGRRLFLASRTFELVDAIRTQVSAQDRNATHPHPHLVPDEMERIRAAKHLLVSDLKVRWTVEDLGRSVGLSPKKLNDGFRIMFGDTAYGVIKAERMNEALNLLKTRGLPVALVAYEVGYNPAYFSSEFRRFFGCSPSKLVVRQ